MRQVETDPLPIVPRDPATGCVVEVARDWALFLDVDGTLLHIAETPAGVEVNDHLRQILARLAPLFGRAVALISGRPIAELDRLFAPLVLPAAGLHGLERRDAAGRVRRLGDPAWLDGLRPALGAFASGHPGVILEDKRRALALHYRRAPQAEAAARRLVAEVTESQQERFRVVDGKMVLEIKPRLADKGAAVAAFLEEPPFEGRRPVFIGDDVTDEDAFAVVNRLGGHSVRVGDAPETRASYRLPNVNTVVTWLESLPGALAAWAPGGRS
jgi:trehalose 6-phosphate phosphatase